MEESVSMELVGVRIELPTNTPILLLREREGSRFLPIWIGTVEATAIALALEGAEPPRPMTHDLLRDVTVGLGADVSRVTVTHLEDGTFYAELVLEHDGQETILSARPSDAIALAARTTAEIFALRPLLDEVGVEIQDEGQEEEIERFREFLDDIRPEDFGAGFSGS